MRASFHIRIAGAHQGRGAHCSSLSRRVGWSGIVAALIFVFVELANAQAPLSDLIFTVGTTTRDQGTDWSYVVMGSPSPEIFRGKRFAVYGKQGDPSSPNTFTQRGTIAQQSDAAAVNALLNQSVALGQNLSKLNDGLNLLLRRVAGISNQPLVNKVVAALTLAQTDQQAAVRLEMLVKDNPGLNICLGRAFAEQVSTITTYELREISGAGTVGDVIGRATITPGSPIVLPEPGKPFHVISADASDDLLIRLRWSTPDPLRRLLLAGYGFNVWRIGETQAVAGNFHKVPPTTAQLLSNPNFTRINLAPVQAPVVYDAQSMDSGDTRTYFFADDNGRSTGNAPFADGARFYYFVTARDVLGKDGTPSRGALGQACRRRPPQAPVGISLRDEPLVDVSSNVVQRFRLTWPQSTNDSVSAYWIYRWNEPSMAYTNGAVPFLNRIGVVPQSAVTNIASLLDTNSMPPTNTGPAVYWYTVRSVITGVCGPVLSPHSAPVSGVLRERTGPAAPVGGVLGSCGTPVVIVSNFARVAVSNMDTSRWHYLFSCERRDPSVAWVQFFATNLQGAVESIGPIYFAADEQRLEVEYSTPRITHVATVACVVGTTADQVSKPASFTITSANIVGRRTDVSFFSGTVLLTAVNSSDPLYLEINSIYGGSYCGSPSSVQIDPSGTVTMSFILPAGRPILVQGNTNGTWFDIGTAFPEANATYSISYPACLTGPMPQFRGCVIDLPNDGTCTEHISRAADAGSIAPIAVHFSPTPRTREYRIYRQTDDGVMSLMSQGRTRYDPARPNRRILVHDDVMPAASSRLCYFVQLFDENGNASPLAALGCKEAQPPAPPRPVLAEPVPAGSVADPQVALNWFCPTAGVHRFRFLIKRVDKKPDLVPETARSSIGFVSTLLTRSRPVRHIGSFLRSRVGNAVAAASSVVTVDEGQLTPTLASGFGPGPQFTLTASVLPNVPYQISVQALNSRDQAGPISEVWEFTWRPPTVVNNVPWPARALPLVEAFDTAMPVPTPVLSPRVAVILFTNVNRWMEDYEFPIGIRIGEFDRTSDHFTLQPNVGTNRFARFTMGTTSPNLNPMSAVFRRASSNPARRGELVLPFVVYRQQVTNAAFPSVSGDLVQVSPLIDKIPWTVTSGGGISTVTIPDRLFAIREHVAPTGVHAFLYLRDQQPVINRARYRYLLARFSPDGEIDQIIPAGEVQVDYLFNIDCDSCL